MIVEKKKRTLKKKCVRLCVCIRVDGQISVKLRMKCYWIEKKILLCHTKSKGRKASKEKTTIKTNQIIRDKKLMIKNDDIKLIF